MDITGVALAAGRASVADAIQSEPLASPEELLAAAELEAASRPAPAGPGRRYRRSSAVLRVLDESSVILPILGLTMALPCEEWDLDAVRPLVAQLSPGVSVSASHRPFLAWIKVSPTGGGGRVVAEGRRALRSVQCVCASS